MRRPIIAMTAVAALAGPFAAGADAKVTKLKFTSEPGARAVVDNPPARSAPDQPLSPGDMQVFTNRILSGGKQLGTAYGVCITIAHPLSHCSVTAVLPKGTLALMGTLDEATGVTRSAIIGGTGAYRRARGDLVGTGNSGTLKIIT